MDGSERERIAALERFAEEAYDQMYESRFGISGLYSDVKECLYDAIRLAREIGDTATADRLQARLDNIKAVYRSQFT